MAAAAAAAVVPVHHSSPPRFFFYNGNHNRNKNNLVRAKLIMEKSPRKSERFCISNLKGGVCPSSFHVYVGHFSTFKVTTMDFQRRDIMFSVIGILIGNLWRGQEDQVASASQFADMPALRGKDYGKSKMRYPDYSETESGLQYKDLRVGTGPSPKMGETVVIDWDGYTIGYLGRIFEARNKAKGGPFEGGDKEFLKFKLGSQQVIPAFEESLVGMAPGGIRRIIVPPELGYPDNDFNKLGPRPMTFSGQRHLDFVLKNEGLIDKTLLFDIELIKILPN